MIYPGYCYIVSLLIIVTIANKDIVGDKRLANLQETPFKPQFDNLSLAKEFILNSISIVHFQSTLMIMGSERDFPLNISSGNKFHSIHYPHSYRTTLVQMSSDMHRVFADMDNTMYRLQLAMKQIPDYIKTILKLRTAASPMLMKTMLPTYFNRILRTTNDSVVGMKKTIDQFTTLGNFVNDVQLAFKNTAPTFGKHQSGRTDLVLSNGFDSKNVFTKIEWTIQQIKQELNEVLQILVNLDRTTTMNLSLDSEMIHLISILYHIENTVYFLYQLANIYGNLSNRYVSDQLAGIGRFVLLASDEERFTSLSNLSQKRANILKNVKQVMSQSQDEYDMNNVLLRQAYEKLRDEWQNRSTL